MKNYIKDELGGGSLIQIRNNKLLSFCRYLFLWCWLGISIASTDSIPIQPVNKLFSFGAEYLSLPSDVAILHNKIYVVDGSHHRIVVFDLHGQYLFDFGGKGARKGELYYPVGLSAGDDNKIYVADSGNHRIQIFSAQGKIIGGFKVAFKGEKIRPIDVILHKQNHNIYVTANKSHNVLIYNQQGKQLTSWGENGITEGSFRYPATLLQMNDGRVAVVDVLNSRAQVFMPNGKLSFILGQWGAVAGSVVRPKGIAIDENNHLYLSDSYMGVVQSYTDGGQFIAVLGQKNKAHKLNTPVGMTVDKLRLYVVEMRSNQVSVYQLNDK